MIVSKISKGIDWLSKSCGLLASVLLLLMALFTVLDVIGRYFFLSPLAFVWETNNYLLAATVLLGGAYVLLIDGHVRVDIFYSRLSPRTRAIVDVFMFTLMALPYLAWINWLFIGFALRALREREVSDILLLPLFPIKLLLPIGTSLLILQLLCVVGRKIVFLKRSSQ